MSGNKTDIHLHICSTKRIPELLKYCETAGIQHAGLVSLPDSVRGNFNNETLAAVKTDSQRFTAFGCLDHRLSRTEAGGAAQVKRLKKDGFSGLKLWAGKPAAAQMFSLRLEDGYLTGALKAASDLEMPVLIHLADPPDFWKKNMTDMPYILHHQEPFLSGLNAAAASFQGFPR